MNKFEAIMHKKRGLCATWLILGLLDRAYININKHFL